MRLCSLHRHKAKVGVDAWETPKEYAFCVYTLEGTEMFVVPDARLDARFKDNPLVTGPPNIRFYAGVPIRSRLGEAIATLCVLDRVPRTLSEDQNGALEMLSRQVAQRFESLRRGAA
jgi:GAF domain-containing protein